MTKNMVPCILTAVFAVVLMLPCSAAESKKVAPVKSIQKKVVKVVKTVEQQVSAPAEKFNQKTRDETKEYFKIPDFDAAATKTTGTWHKPTEIKYGSSEHEVEAFREGRTDSLNGVDCP